METIGYRNTNEGRRVLRIGLVIAFLCLLVMCRVEANAEPQSNPEKLNNIRKLIELRGGTTEMKRRMLEVSTSLGSSAGGVEAELVEAFGKELEGKSLDELMKSLESVYDQHLTDEEVRELLKFEESPSGSAINKKMPAIVSETNRIGAAWGRSLAIKVVGKRIGLVGCALMAGQMSAVAELLASGEDVNSVNAEGMTALIATASRGDLEMAKFLLEKGANVNSRANDGQTALMAAVSSGNAKLVELLISKGADANAKDDRGVNAYQLAELNGNKAVAALLKKKTADKSPVRERVVVGTLGDAKDCLPVMNFPTASSTKIQCLKIGQEVEPTNSETNDGWQLIRKPAMGWVRADALKSVILKVEKVQETPGNSWLETEGSEAGSASTE
jgi:hypothetical protein